MTFQFIYTFKQLKKLLKITWKSADVTCCWLDCVYGGGAAATVAVGVITAGSLFNNALPSDPPWNYYLL